MGTLSKSNMCRLCGWEDEKNMRIEEQEVCIVINSMNLLTAKVSELIEQNMNLILETSLDLPDKICPECKTGVQVTAEFLARVREGQIYIQKLLKAQGSSYSLEKRIKMNCDAKPLNRSSGKRGRPKKGYEKARPPPAPSLGNEFTALKRRRKPPKHLAEFLDVDGKDGGRFHDSADEDNILNIDEDPTEEYNPLGKPCVDGTSSAVLCVYKCDFCDNIFNAENDLTRHTESAHAEFMYRCAYPTCELLVRNKKELISHQSSTKHQGIITVSLLQPGVNQSQPDPSTFFNTSKPDPPGLHSLGKNILLEDDVDGLEESLLAGVQFGGNPDDPLDGPGLSMADLVALPSSKPSLSRCLLCESPFEPGEKDHICPVLLYNCDACPEVLRSKIAYRTHLNKVHNLSESRIYECDQCTRIFTAQSSLHYHRDSTHSTLTYKCEEEGCSKVFKVKNLLTRHMRSHGNKRPFKCDKCDKGFKSYNNLKSHISSHELTDKSFCDICGQAFKHASSLNLHMRLHTGEKKYVCTFCGKAFTQNGNLREHMRVHTGEKPFSCKQCPSSFTTSSQLRNHVARHAGNKKFTCPHCPKRFLHMDSLKIHVRRHTGEKPYSCDQCKKKFTDSASLNKHVQTHDKDRSVQTCKVCGKGYSDKSNLLKHMKTHKDGDESKSTVWNIIKDVSENCIQDDDADELHQVIYVAYEDRGEGEQTTIDLTVKDGQQIRLVAPLNIDPLTFAAEYLKDLQSIPETD